MILPIESSKPLGQLYNCSTITYDEITKILDSCDLNKELEEIRITLEKFYTSLKETFSIRDILPTVEDMKSDNLNLRYPYIDELSNIDHD